MKLTMLGTGNALVSECYNTCFVLEDNHQYLLVDAGGGNTILKQLKNVYIDWKDIKSIFVTHKHIDHLMGIIWMMRMILQHMKQGEYIGEVHIYAHKEVIDILSQLAQSLLQKKDCEYIGKRLFLVVVSDKESVEIMNHTFTFFDIHSTKAKQFGFYVEFDDHKTLTCCGDEPYNDYEKEYAFNSTWLMHEAFCLEEEADIFHPYEKHHSTVKDACQIAQQLHVKNLILYHTEDKNIQNREYLYKQEGQRYYDGNIFVPEDLTEMIL